MEYNPSVHSSNSSMSYNGRDTSTSSMSTPVENGVSKMALSEMYTPEELQYSPIRRLASSPGAGGSMRAVGSGSGGGAGAGFTGDLVGPRRLRSLKQRMDRKVSMPVKGVHRSTTDLTKDPIKKVHATHTLYFIHSYSSFQNYSSDFLLLESVLVFLLLS